VANISTYASKATAVRADKLLGSDSTDSSTKNFGIAAVFGALTAADVNTAFANATYRSQGMVLGSSTGAAGGTPITGFANAQSTFGGKVAFIAGGGSNGELHYQELTPDQGFNAVGSEFGHVLDLTHTTAAPYPGYWGMLVDPVTVTAATTSAGKAGNLRVVSGAHFSTQTGGPAGRTFDFSAGADIFNPTLYSVNGKLSATNGMVLGVPAVTPVVGQAVLVSAVDAGNNATLTFGTVAAGGGGVGAPDFIGFVASKPGVAMPIEQRYGRGSTVIAGTHYAGARTGATAACSLTLSKYTLATGVTTTVGTFNFPAGGGAGRANVTMTLAASVPLAVGDVLIMTMPTVNGGTDTSLADISWNVLCTTP